MGPRSSDTKRREHVQHLAEGYVELGVPRREARLRAWETIRLEHDRKPTRRLRRHPHKPHPKRRPKSR